ncbi:MAG: serine hydrolase [Ignavibacteriae bacterium]|nr:serine hydrolase [Ignavibacteriota bacterium]
MKTLFITLGIILFFVLISGNSTSAQQFNANLAAKLQQTLDAQLAAFPDTKGVSASVYYPGQGIWKGTSGVSYAGHPITSDMEFAIASNTKLFTAVAIMKLVESNKLSLNDQLHKWLPKYANVDSSITIRQLLNHKSGVADVFNAASMAFIDANPAHVFTIAEVMAWVGPKLFKPGAGFSYSNTNYILAGMVAESASGIEIHKIIRDSILIPLQLDSTFYDGKETVLGTIAHPWEKKVDVFNISRTALNTLGTSCGAMFSTAGEMAQWYQALMSGQVVNANSLKEITTFLSPGNYGFGFSTSKLFGRTVWGHGGTNTGYNSRMFYDPEMKTTLCGLSNSNPSVIDGAILGVMYKALVDALPATAGVISGSATVCQGQNSVTYTVPVITKASSYVWTLPNGASGISVTNSITVNYGASAQSGAITVCGSNSYGNGAPATLPIIVNQVPTVVITGATEVAINALKQYSIQQIQGTITWIISGGIIKSGQGTSQISVAWGGAGTGSISASILLPSGCTAAKTIDVTIFEAATGATLAVWYDASHIIGAVNGQTLPFTAPFTESHPSWQDISGNERGAYMMAGNQPLIPTYYNQGANTVNELPAVRFDQINDVLIVNNSAAVNAGSTKTLFSVFKTGSDITADQVIFESGGGAPTQSGFNIYIHKGDIGFGVWNGNKSIWIHKTCSANTSFLTQLVYDGNAGILRVSVNNATATATGVPATLQQGTQFNGLGASIQGTRLRMGYSNATLAFPFGGSIAEVMLYNTVSSAIRSQTFSYLNAKYGFSLGTNQLLKTARTKNHNAITK